MATQETETVATGVVVTTLDDLLDLKDALHQLSYRRRGMLTKEQFEFLGLFRVTGVRFTRTQLDYALKTVEPLEEHLTAYRERALLMRNIQTGRPNLMAGAAQRRRFDDQYTSEERLEAATRIAVEWQQEADDAERDSRCLHDVLVKLETIRDKIKHCERAMRVGLAALAADGLYSRGL